MEVTIEKPGIGGVSHAALPRDDTMSTHHSDAHVQKMISGEHMYSLE